MKVISKYKHLGKCIKDLIYKAKNEEEVIEYIGELKDHELIDIAQ
jgi:hypothetical protein